MQFTISGQTPAKKNSRDLFKNPRTGKPIIKPNAAYDNWQAAALYELIKVPKFGPGRVQIDYMFYVTDNAQRDLDNMIASVNDCLQVAKADSKFQRGKVRPVKGTGILAGDNWQLLRIGSADAAIDRENPRAVMTVTEVPPVA